MSVYRGVVTVQSPSLGGIGTNTWHVRTDSIDDAGDDTLQALGDHLETFYTAIQVYFAGLSNVSFDGVWSQVDSGGETVIQRDGWDIASTTGGTPLPPQDCYVVGWRSATGKRKGRGRTFLGPLSKVTLQDNGTPDETFRTAVASAANDLVTYSRGLANGAYVVWSHQEKVGRDFIGHSERNVFGTLRSRRD